MDELFGDVVDDWCGDDDDDDDATMTVPVPVLMSCPDDPSSRMWTRPVGCVCCMSLEDVAGTP